MGYKEHTVHETRVNKAVTKSFKSYCSIDPYSWGDLELLMKMNAVVQNYVVLYLTKTTGNERRNITCFNKIAQKLCGWSALALRESGWWMQNTMNIHRIVKILAKEADAISVSQLHPLHSSSLFPCLCSSDLRCYVKKSARKKTVMGKIHDVFKASSGFTSLYQYSSHLGYLKSLVCFKKEALLRYLGSQMVHAKYSTE